MRHPMESSEWFEVQLEELRKYVRHEAINSVLPYRREIFLDIYAQMEFHRAQALRANQQDQASPAVDV